MSMNDPHATLGVGRDATLGEIKRAFRHLAKEFHPDRNGGDTAAADKLRDVIAAYELLEFDRALTDAVRIADLGAISNAARAQLRNQSLTRQAMMLATGGVTTVAEVIGQLNGIDDERRNAEELELLGEQVA